MQRDGTACQNATTRVIVWNGGDAGHAETLDEPFVRTEKERAIALNRPAEDTAKLMPRELRLRLVRRIEEVPRIQCRVAMELEYRPGITVRARSRDGIEHAAGRASEFCRVRVGQDLELEHRFDTEQHAGGRAGSFVVDVVDVGAVQQEAVHLGTRAVDRDLRRAAADDIVAGRQRGLHAGLQQRELLERSAIERQVPDLAFADKAAHRARRQVERHGVAAHRELFGNHAELEGGVQDGNLANGQANAAMHERPKASQLDVHFVLARRERRHLEMARRVRDLFV